MMGFIEPEQAEQAPSPMRMEQEQAVAAEGEAAPREEEVVPEGSVETGKEESMRERREGSN